MQDVLRCLGEGGPTVGKPLYRLESESCAGRRYVGSANNLHRRLSEHNADKCKHTRKFLPWSCVVALRFADDAKAAELERYLKTGSGRAFLKRHFTRPIQFLLLRFPTSRIRRSYEPGLSSGGCSRDGVAGPLMYRPTATGHPWTAGSFGRSAPWPKCVRARRKARRPWSSKCRRSCRCRRRSWINSISRGGSCAAGNGWIR